MKVLSNLMILAISSSAWTPGQGADGQIDDLPYAVKLSTDPASEIRAEAASAMRYRKIEDPPAVLVNLAKGYDGKDRSYLKILGVGAGHPTAALWLALVESMKPGEPAVWSDRFALLTWRLKPEAAIPALKLRASDVNLTVERATQVGGRFHRFYQIPQRCECADGNCCRGITLEGAGDLVADQSQRRGMGGI
jgi:hypothetical protein